MDEEAWATNKEFYYTGSREMGVRWVCGDHIRISKMRSVKLCLEVDGVI